MFEYVWRLWDGMTRLPADAAMARFVASLHDSQVRDSVMQLEAGTVITLPDGVSWLGHSTDFSNQVFVRSAYPEMLRARDAYRAAGRVFKATLITGTPGIGKSHLCALLVARTLIEGKTVLFERHNIAGGGGADVAETSCDEKARAVLRQQGDVVYIVDGGAQSLEPGSHEREVYVFASANPAVFKLDRKHEDTLVLYMPLFDLEELQLCRREKAAAAGVA